MSIKPVVIANKSNIDKVIKVEFGIHKNPFKKFQKVWKDETFNHHYKSNLDNASKDFNNVTLLFDDHKFHAHKVILAVNIAAAFPIGEASPHSTGSSRGVTSLGSGHWRQV